jgi:hypothetical protein
MKMSEEKKSDSGSSTSTALGGLIQIMTRQIHTCVRENLGSWIKNEMFIQAQKTEQPFCMVLQFPTVEPEPPSSVCQLQVGVGIIQAAKVVDAAMKAMMAMIARDVNLKKEVAFYCEWKSPPTALYVVYDVEQVGRMADVAGMDGCCRDLGLYACRQVGSWAFQRVGCLDSVTQYNILYMHPSNLHKNFAEPSITMKKAQERASADNCSAKDLVCFLLFDDRKARGASSTTTTTSSSSSDTKASAVATDKKSIKEVLKMGYGTVIGLILGHKVTDVSDSKLVIHHFYLPIEVTQSKPAIEHIQAQLKLYCSDFGLKRPVRVRKDKDYSESYAKFYDSFDHNAFWKPVFR